MMKISNKST